MAHERNCTVCGKQYNYCPKCLQYSNMEKWHISYCSEQCRNTYLIINKYAFKHIDKNQAKTLLEGNGISKDFTVLPKLKDFINDIFKEEEKKKVEKIATKSMTKTTAKKSTRKKKSIVNED